MPTEAETVFAEIARLFHNLQQLPDATIACRTNSPAYIDLEAQIRTLCGRYVRLTDEPTTTLKGTQTGDEGFSGNPPVPQ